MPRRRSSNASGLMPATASSDSRRRTARALRRSPDDDPLSGQVKWLDGLWWGPTASYRSASASPWLPGPRHRGWVPGAAAPCQSPQQAELAIEQHACAPAVDLPAPRVREIKRAADLAGAAMCDGPEPLWIAAMAAIPFGEV